MRTATPETARALRQAIGKTPYSRWARAHGLLPATVHAALNGQPMKARRENTVREVVGLPPILFETVEIVSGAQKIVNVQQPRPYRTRQVRLTPDEAADLDQWLAARGYRSFSHYWRAEHLPCHCSSPLEHGQTARACNGEPCTSD